jgi:8-oxo-dGTP pyrophosphatase MutT (NUDIX family)
VHRHPLLEALRRYADRHELEQAVVVRMSEFVQSHPDCFERSCVPGHVTGSAWVVSPERDAALLLHHRKLDIWVQPGGHCDGESDTLAVALREAREETGLDVEPLVAEPFDIDIHSIPERGADPAHLHYDVRYLLVAYDRNFAASAESHELAWVEPGALARYTSEVSIVRMVGKWKRML